MAHKKLIISWILVWEENIHHVLKRKKLNLKACSEQNEIVFAHAKRKNRWIMHFNNSSVAGDAIQGAKITVWTSLVLKRLGDKLKKQH